MIPVCKLLPQSGAVAAGILKDWQIGEPLPIDWPEWPIEKRLSGCFRGLASTLRSFQRANCAACADLLSRL
jgi:hypothetical protein